MKRLAAVAVAAALASGCASTAVVAPEAVWQALNVVDAGQTVTIAREPDRFHEVDPLTAGLIGQHPTTAHVYECMAGYAVGHAAVTALLASQYGPGWNTALVVWQALTIGGKAYTVGKNEGYHINPWMGREGGAK